MSRDYQKTYRKIKRVQRETEYRRKGFPKRTLYLVMGIVGGAVVAAVIAGNVMVGNKKEETNIDTDSNIQMGGVSRIPYIDMLTGHDTIYNRLTGYASKNFSKDDTGYTYAYLPSDRRQKIYISVTPDEIERLSFQIRDPDNGVLVEENDVTEISEAGGKTVAVITVKDLINTGHIYNMQIKLELKDQSTAILYNTRIADTQGDQIDKEIRYINEFTGKIFDESQTEFISKETYATESAEASNYAYADINSATSLIMWKGVSAQILEQPVPSVIKADRDTVVITQSYPVSYKGADEKEERVIVNEAFTLEREGALEEEEETQETKEEVYGPRLISYERKAYETLDSDDLRITEERFCMGLQADERVQCMSSKTGQYICFVNGGNLWRVCSGTGTENGGFVRLFSFKGDDGVKTDITELIDVTDEGKIKSARGRNGIRVLEVTDDGDATFAVYGAFPSGKHEGESGIGVYRYYAKEKKLKEAVFVKTDRNLEGMRQLVSECYLNDYGELYLTSDSQLKRINIRDYTSETMTRKAINDICSHSDDNSKFAYATADYGGAGLALELTTYDCDDGASRTIREGDDGLQLIGYMGNDLVYGVAEVGDIERDTGGTKVYLKKIIIADKDGNEVKSYEKEGEYFSDVYIENATVAFTCYKKKDDGGFVKTDTNRLVTREEGDGGCLLKFDATDTRRRVLYMYFTKGANDSTGEDAVLLEDYEYMDGNIVEI